jgi:hypothetical protein
MSTGESGGRVAHDDHDDEDGPRPVHGGPDTTLGGYFLEHRRPPGFEGVDGEPYTVALEVEKTPNLASPFEGYLVFPRWAATGLGVVGHVETPTLASGRSREGVLEELGQVPLGRVKALLDEAIGRHAPRGTRSGDPRLHTGGVDGVEE